MSGTDSPNGRSAGKPAALSAQSIEVAYGQGPDAPALLAELTLQIAQGELIAVVGPNGSGKSTLIRALSRTLKPRQGVALLDEKDLYEQVPARRAAQKIGVVPQETHVAFDFTVREVVAMGRSPHQRPSLFPRAHSEDRQVVDEALARAGIGPELAERKISEVSGGERQRALVARALAQEAQILLLDEPTASLDIRHVSALLQWLRELAKEHGRAVLVVLHDLNLAAAYADRVIVLAGGRIAAQGTPAEALTAETIQTVYGARVWVRCHPASGRPYILNLPAPFEAGSTGEKPAALSGRRIHLLCGGGTGAPLMAALVGQGAIVSAGALGQGDTDEEVAALLGVPHATVPPFSPITPQTLGEALAMAEPCELVVLTEVPFGEGNLATLEAAVALARLGRTVLVAQAEGEEFDTRDFTKERRARALWDELMALPSVRVVQDAASAIGQAFGAE